MVERSLFEYAQDFEARLLERELEEAFLTIGFHYEDSVPVVDIYAELGERGYVDSYRLEEISIEEFEEDIYDVWVETFDDHFEGVLHR